MTYNSKANLDFAHYLNSVVCLDALDRMTKDLDEELMDSQKVMDNIKGLIEALPKKGQTESEVGASDGLRHEDISTFLAASTPKLLPPDMAEDKFEVDIDVVIATMKSYTEDMKKNFMSKRKETPVRRDEGKMESMDIEQYAVSLDLLCKRLSNLKLNKKDEVNNRNMELEAKLSLLCNDINMFTQVVQSKTKLTEANKNWTPMQNNDESLNYDNLINKLLAGINEVTYLLQSKN